MAFDVNIRQVGDHYIAEGGENVVPGQPKSGWTPVKGELVHREVAAANEFDVVADTQVFQGIVETTNGPRPAGIALFAPKLTIVLPTDTTLTLGDKVVASAGGLKQVGTSNIERTQVKASGAGVGTVIEVSPWGLSGTGTEDTATVEF